MVFFSRPPLGKADDYTGSTMKVVDPVLAPGAYGSSTSYQLFGSLGELSPGTSTASSFGLKAGFLFFPHVTTPAVAATAGDTQVNLSWTVSSGFLGWTVSGYTVGQSTTSGGPYTYTSVGNVTSATRASLINSTPYYFVVRVQDAFSNFIATSTEVTATPVVSNSGGGGGGGGGGSSITGVRLSGRAYPLSTITVLKDGQLATETIAGPDARFKVSLTGLSAGAYNLVLYGTDQSNRRSSLFTFPVTITAGSVTDIGGIFIAPTIALDKSEVKQGDNLAIFGQTTPEGNVTISIHSPEEFFVNTPSDDDGVYLYNLNTSPLSLGDHLAKSKAEIKNELSAFGPSASFAVGNSNVAVPPTGICPLRADLNDDCRVNLVDFSIAAYWWRRPLTSAFVPRELAKLNGDGQVDLIDFSIMAYYWTG